MMTYLKDVSVFGLPETFEEARREHGKEALSKGPF
jgi:hypothetical protein